jgi:anti-sigma28 factor (negative regulator of flagellin synthesis)
MLAYVLAIAIGLISIAFFLAAFFAPKVHRQDDFLWSGVGLFYALVLWVCAERLTGALLLGQTAATLLLLAYGAETINLRGAIANPEKIPAMKSFSVTAFLLGFSGGLFNLFRKPKVQLETTPQPQVAVKEETTAVDRAVIEPETTQTEESLNSSQVTAAVNTEKQVEIEPVQAATNAETSGIETNQTTEVTKPLVTETSQEIEAIAPAIRETKEKIVATDSQFKTVKQENFFSRLFGKNKSKETGLTAAPILEADEEFEEEKRSQTPVTQTPTTPETTETPSVEPKTVAEVVNEAVETLENAEIAEENATENKIEIIEKIIIEPKDFKTEIPSTNSGAIAETQIETSPLETPIANQPEAIAEAEVEEVEITSKQTSQPESSVQSETIEEDDKPKNLEQPQSTEVKEDEVADLKAEIAKIFEEDDKRD